MYPTIPGQQEGASFTKGGHRSGVPAVPVVPNLAGGRCPAARRGPPPGRSGPAPGDAGSPRPLPCPGAGRPAPQRPTPGRGPAPPACPARRAARWGPARRPRTEPGSHRLPAEQGLVGGAEQAPRQRRRLPPGQGFKAQADGVAAVRLAVKDRFDPLLPAKGRGGGVPRDHHPAEENAAGGVRAYWSNGLPHSPARSLPPPNRRPMPEAMTTHPSRPKGASRSTQKTSGRRHSSCRKGSCCLRTASSTRLRSIRASRAWQ